MTGLTLALRMSFDSVAPGERPHTIFAHTVVASADLKAKNNRYIVPLTDINLMAITQDDRLTHEDMESTVGGVGAVRARERRVLYISENSSLVSRGTYFCC